MITRQRLCWILAFASLLLGSGVLAIDKIIDRQFPARPGGTFELDSDRGSVAIASGADDHVAVRIRLRARAGSASQADEIFEDFRVHFDETGDGVTMEARCARDGWSLFGSGDNKLNVHFEVEVPARFNLRVKTGGGGISVTDLEGDIQCRTSGGSLSFGHIGGTLHGRTSGGSIRLDDCHGPVDVETSGGSITMGRVAGPVIAHTSGGSITVQAVMGRIDASTSGGSIKATLTHQPQDDCRLRTSGGSITVHLPAAVRLSIDAHTSGGKVYSDFSHGEKPGRSLKADVNGGGPELHLKTSGGSIYIKTD